MAALGAVPIELLEEIFAYLDAADLHSLSLVSWKANKAAEPCLYASVELKWDSYKDWSPSLRFLRSIIRRPELALLVRRAKFMIEGFWDSTSRAGRRGSECPLTHSDLQLAHDLIEKMQLPLSDQWREGIMYDLFGSAALVLSQLVNVRSVVFDVWFQDQCLKSRSRDPVFKPNLMAAFLNHTLVAPSSIEMNRFQKLEQVELSPVLRRGMSWTAARYLDLTDQVLPFLYAPCLKSATVNLDNGANTLDGYWNPSQYRTLMSRRKNPWPTGVPPKASSLTSLNLRESIITEDTLKQVLVHLPNLKTFNFEYVRTINMADDDISGFHGAMIVDALRACKTCLEHLSISFTLVSGRREGSEFEGAGPEFLLSPLGSLKDFPALQTLEIALPSLLGWTPKQSPALAEVLPSSLRELRVRDDWIAFRPYRWTESRTIRALSKLIESGMVPRLEKLEMILDRARGEWLKSHREAIRILCETSGIQCSIHKRYQELGSVPSDSGYFAKDSDSDSEDETGA